MKPFKIEIGEKFGPWTVIDRGHENKRTFYVAKCPCGTIKPFTSTILKKRARNNDICKCSYKFNAEKEIGNKYNRLTIIGIDTKKRPREGHIFYICECECGNIRSILKNRVFSGYVKSCGCLGAELSVKRRRHNDRNPALNATLRYYKHSAKNRCIGWELTDEESQLLFEAACYYCGSGPNATTTVNGHEYIHNGIDRLDPSRGYTSDNVVSCCRRCNMGKWDYNEEEFILWVSTVYKHLKRCGKISDEALSNI